MSPLLASAYAITRGLIFISLLGLVGLQTAGVLLAATPLATTALGPAERDRMARRIVAVLLVLLAINLARGLLQVLSFRDPGDPVTADLVEAVLLTGSWAHAWLLQIGVTIVLVLWSGSRNPGLPGARTVPLIGLAAILWGQTGMGHSAGERWHGPWGRLLDLSHLTGAGLWLGTLAVLTMFVFPRLREPGELSALAGMVRRFSVAARVGISLIVGSGIIQAVVYAGSVTAFLSSTWGRLLLVKIFVLTGVLALGWYNWRVVTPALERGDLNSAPRLRRAVQYELLLGVILLAITTVLVASPLPGEL